MSGWLGFKRRCNLLNIFFLFFLSFTEANAEFLPKSFISKFEQEYVSSLKGKIKKGEGTIEYKFPSKIRFETSIPSRVVYVSNGEKAWYYRAPFIEGEAGEVSEFKKNEASAMYIKLFDSLKNGLKSNAHYTIKKINETEFQLSFLEKFKKELGINSSKLFFNSAKKEMKFEDLKKMELIFSNDKKSTLIFVEIKSNVEILPNRFEFVAPKNTNKI